MKIIIAPHPDDEWIGCGCTILKSLNNKENIKILIITRAPHSEKRINTSKLLSNKYNYKLGILGEPEKKIDDLRLLEFLEQNILEDDVLYIPDMDTHKDHQKITKALQNNFKNIKYQYCVYNNSSNIFRRIKNKFIFYVTRKALPSFCKGRQEKIFIYKLDEKNENIKRFGEIPRSGDVLRLIKNEK